MPISGFSVGRDVTLNIVTSSGPLSLSLITGFQSKMDNIVLKVKGMDGVTRNIRFPDAWTGRFMLERQDSTIDDYFAQIESNYYAGLSEQGCSITQSITELNGSVSQYRYINTLLTLDDAGEWGGDKTVKQTISFTAWRRVKIA